MHERETGAAQRVAVARGPAALRAEREHELSRGGVAGEGVAECGGGFVVVEREAERIRVGDPDDDALSNEYVGDDTPGGSTPTPDQGNVDDIGRAYGLQDEDSGELRTSTELMETRDRRRRGLALKRRRS